MNALTIHQPQVPSFEVGDIWKMAQAVAASGLFGMKRPEEAMALMLVAQAEGTHPALAARDYHIVDGRPTLKADAMLARFMQAGGRVEWHAYDDEEVKASFSHPQGGKVTVDWSLKRASKITRKGKRLTDGDNWKNYPRAMLRARVISEGIRTVFPGCVVGVYTPEEVQDFDDQPSRGRAEPSRAAPAPIETTAVEVAAESGMLVLAGDLLRTAQSKAEFTEIWNTNKASWKEVMSDADYAAVVKVMRSEAARWASPAPQPPADPGDFGDIADAASALTQDAA